MKILVVEDDLNIRKGIIDILNYEGYIMIEAENGIEAVDKFTQEKPDFIILDIMMPEKDGYSVCRDIRKQDENIPILFLSAKDEEIDRVLGLELGADDYMSKPFGIHELRARIKAITKRSLRRSNNYGNADNSFTFGDLQVFPNELKAKRGDIELELSLREVKILQCLFTHKNQVVTRDMLFDFAWGYNYLPNSRTLDQHISKLRKIIELNPLDPTFIKTIHGVGYRYSVPSDAI